MSNSKDYQVHLLRIWREPGAEASQSSGVRLSLENTKTSVRVGFADWDAFMAYLRDQVDGSIQIA